MPFLRQKSTIKTAKQCLYRLHRIAALQHKAVAPAATAQPPAGTVKVNVREFLAAYMLIGFPAYTFANPNGELEQRLVESGRRMLETFEGICDAVRAMDTPSPAALPRPLTERFPEDFHEYLRCFRAWKVPDESQLAQRILHALRAIYEARATLAADPHETRTPGVMAQLNEQYAKLTVTRKLAQINGQEAVDNFEAAMRASAVLHEPPAVMAELNQQYAQLTRKLAQISGQEAVDNFEAAMRASAVLPGALPSPGA